RVSSDATRTIVRPLAQSHGVAKDSGNRYLQARRRVRANRFQEGSQMTVAKETAELLAKLGVNESAFSGGDLEVRSPVTGEKIAALKSMSASQASDAIEAAHEAFKAWRMVPAPRRGELVRLLGEELRAHKADLGRLVSIEVGKIPSEGLGEVQEM